MGVCASPALLIAALRTVQKARVSRPPPAAPLEGFGPDQLPRTRRASVRGARRGCNPRGASAAGFPPARSPGRPGSGLRLAKKLAGWVRLGCSPGGEAVGSDPARSQGSSGARRSRGGLPPQKASRPDPLSAPSDAPRSSPHLGGACPISETRPLSLSLALVDSLFLWFVLRNFQEPLAAFISKFLTQLIEITPTDSLPLLRE